MKYFRLSILTVFLSLFLASCDRDLPYDLDGVLHGVVIDVARVANTDGVLSAGDTQGDFRLNLTIPTQQGDYSMMDHAQLLCVYTNAAGVTKETVVMDNITTFPAELTLNMDDIYSQIGAGIPELGELLVFTVNVVLNNGTVIPGWTEIAGYNNTAFTGWQVNGRGYSYMVRYPVACPLDINDFVGEFTLQDPFYMEADVPVTIRKITDTQLELTRFWDTDIPLVINVDPKLHEISIPETIFYPSFPPYANLRIPNSSGTLDACNISMTFTAPSYVTVGGNTASYGTFRYVITKNP